MCGLSPGRPLNSEASVNKMKKIEYIEMGLKTLAALLAAFLAIVLMEGMIYGIQLNALKTSGTSNSASSGSTIAYCIEEDDDKYFVLYYNKGSEKEWSALKNTYPGHIYRSFLGNFE